MSSTDKQQSQSNDNVIKPLPSSTVHKISSTNKHQSQSNDNVIKPVPSFDFVPSPSSKDLSNRKDVGARVYAEYNNGQYYWGYIGQIIDVSHHYHHLPDKPKVLRYKILFEDGDVLDEVEESKMYTESQYKKFCGSSPPLASPLGMFSRKKKPEQQTNIDNREENDEKTSNYRKTRRLMNLTMVRKEKRKDFNSPIPRKQKLTATTVSDASESKLKRLSKASNKLKRRSASRRIERKTANHSSEKKKKKKKDKSISTTSSNAIPAKNKMLVPKKLRKRACNKCYQCLKLDCQKCHSCLRNKEYQSNSSYSKSVCLQKICSKIRKKQRAQPAYGFPPGWTFLLESPSSASKNQCSYFPRSNTSNITNTHYDGASFSLSLYSRTGRKYTCIETAVSNAISTCPSTYSHKDTSAMSTSLLKHIGIVSATFVDESSHPLIGKPFLQQWVDLCGKNNLLYGVITACNVSKRQRPKPSQQDDTSASNLDDTTSTDDVTFTVEYFDESIEFIQQFWKSSFSSWNIVIPKKHFLTPDEAWGGSLCHERMMVHSHTSQQNGKSNSDSINSFLLKNPKPFKYWVIPDMRKVEHGTDISSSKDNRILPKLTMIARGCKLTFTVKPSTIPKAGLGVFVKCESIHRYPASPLQQQPQRFHLEAGEFFDLGIYAPCRPSDCKHNSIFKLKNYIHGSKCDEWCFNAVDDDYILDITEELTPRVHTEAELQLPMYVNECNNDQTPTIYAQHSPDGFVHYLYGVPHLEGNKTSCALENNVNLFVNGDEKEVFINYGDEYERVRARKGYVVDSPSAPRFGVSNQDAPQQDIVRNNSNKDANKASTSARLEESSFTTKKETENLEEYLDEIDDFCEEELMMCLKYFLDTFLPSHVLTFIEKKEKIDLKEISNMHASNSTKCKDEEKKKVPFFESAKPIRSSFNVAYRIEKRVHDLMSKTIELNNCSIKDDDRVRQHQELLTLSLQFIERLKKVSQKIDPLLDPNFQGSSSSSGSDHSKKNVKAENKEQHKKGETDDSTSSDDSDDESTDEESEELDDDTEDDESDSANDELIDTDDENNST